MHPIPSPNKFVPQGLPFPQGMVVHGGMPWSQQVPMMRGPQPIQPIHEAQKDIDPNDEWTEHTDKETQKPYYFNKRTKQSVWTKPPGFLSQQEKMKPVSSQKIVGTEWSVVFTMSGLSYYYNEVTKKTTWTLPPELNTPKPEAENSEKNTHKRKLEEAEEPPVKKVKLNADDTDYDPLAGTDDLEGNAKREEKMNNKVNEIKPNNNAERLSNESPKPSILNIEKPQKQEQQTQPTLQQKSNESIHAKLDTKSHKEDEDIPYEERIRIFRDLLNESKIDPFTSFKKNLPLLVYDPRFKILNTQAEKKATFDSWMRSRVTAVKMQSQIEKRSLKKKAEDGFKELIEEHKEKITKDTTFDEFRNLVKDDQRYKDLDSRADKEQLLNEVVSTLKSQHNSRVKEALDDFRKLILETSITMDSKWSDMKEDLCKNSRAHSEILTTKEQENIFEERRKQLQKEYEALEKKRKREEAVKKDREREVNAQRERDERRMAREKERLQKDQEVNNFIALLAEHVHDPLVKYETIKRKISRDNRYDTKFLKHADKERLFAERINSLRGNIQHQFTQLLAETPLELDSTWEKVRESIKNEQRFKQIEGERRRQDLFDHFMTNMQIEAENNFFKMLSKFEKINRDTSTEAKELDLIGSMLRGDPQWKKFDSTPEKRTSLLKNYIIDLKEGKIHRSREDMREDTKSKDNYRTSSSSTIRSDYSSSSNTRSDYSSSSNTRSDYSSSNTRNDYTSNRMDYKRR